MKIWTDRDHGDLRIASVLTPLWRTWSEEVKTAIQHAALGPSGYRSSGGIGQGRLGDSIRVPFLPPIKPLLTGPDDPIPPLGASTAFGILTIANVDGLAVIVAIEMPFGYDSTV